MKKLLKNMYLISSILFLLISILGFILGKSVIALIAGVVISLFGVLFNFVFKPKWSEETRDILKNLSETLKPIGETLPLGVVGKITIVFIGIMGFSSLQPLFAKILPVFPNFIFTLLYNIAFAFFLLSLVYNFLQGNFENIAKMSKFFAFYNVADILLTFVLESFKVNTKGMILFTVFYSISYLLTYMLDETDPALRVEEEVEKKPKKSKKKKGEDAEVSEVAEEVIVEETPSE